MTNSSRVTVRVVAVRVGVMERVVLKNSSRGSSISRTSSSNSSRTRNNSRNVRSRSSNNSKAV